MNQEYNEMQQIKRRFFAMRNGAMGDMMRKQGLNYRIIFGLNLPQLCDIANECEKNADLANSLWSNKTTRESLLLAPMVYPHDQFTVETARKWITEIPTIEVADILCHRLLRYMPFAYSLAEEFIDSDNDLSRYTALRIMFNLLPLNIKPTSEYVTYEIQRNCNLTLAICNNLIEEIRFIEESQQ